MATPQVHPFFEPVTFTYSYVVVDTTTQRCAIIDSVLDYDPAAGRTSTESADKIIAFVREQALDVEWILETHVHADHLSAAPYLQQALGGKLGIGANITKVQELFGQLFNEGTEFARDGSQFDCLLEDGDTFTIGTLKARAIHTPGHTPACMTYIIEDAVFVGDTLLCQIMAQLVVTSPVVMRRNYTTQSKKSLRYPMSTEYSCVMIIKRQVAPNIFMKPRWVRSGSITFMFELA